MQTSTIVVKHKKGQSQMKALVSSLGIKGGMKKMNMDPIFCGGGDAAMATTCIGLMPK